MHIARATLEGFVSEWPLNAEELRALPLLVAARFAQGLVLSEYQYRELDPGNEYAREGFIGAHELMNLALSLRDAPEKLLGHK